jgi:L-ribulose-5-phosphate 3-epimerase
MCLHNQKLNRRALFARSAGAFGALAAAGSPLACLLAASDSRRFKIGACDWSLGKRCDPVALDVAAQIGLDGVQIAVGDAGEKLQFCRPDVQQKYQDAAKRTGVEVASVAIDAMWQGPLDSDPRAVRWLSDMIDVCRSLRLPVCMIVNFKLDLGKTASVDHFVQAIKSVAPKAENSGVVIGMENLFCAEDNMRLIDRVGSPALKVYYDVGNSTDKGRDIFQEIRTLGKRNLICEFHFKDGNYMLGSGRIDFKKVRKAIDDVDYSGWLQIEAVAPHGVIPDFTRDRTYLKTIFPDKV